MEEYFTGEAAKLYFRSNGKYFGDKHQRYFMEHAGSAGKISSGQMCDFIKSVGNADLGRIHRLNFKKPLSVRMRKICKDIAKNWKHIYVPRYSWFVLKVICLYSIVQYALYIKHIY